MAWRQLALVALLALPLPFAGAGPDPSYCEANPGDPRCDPSYCQHAQDDPWCQDPSRYCAMNSADPICGAGQTAPCAWSLDPSLATPFVPASVGPNVVSLTCPFHAKLGWECAARDGSSLAEPAFADRTPSTLACVQLREERAAMDTPCGRTWSWLAGRADARVATMRLEVDLAPDLDCDGRADAGAMPQRATFEWRQLA